MQVDTSDPPRQHVELRAGVAAYTDEGQGPPLVMIHGLPGSGRDFRYLAPAVATHHRVIRIDLPGFGETPATTAGVNLDEQAAFVIDVLAALDLEQVVLLAHSAGGFPACAAAVRAPERVLGLALLASVGLTPHRKLRQARMPLVARLIDRPLGSRVFTPLLTAAFRSQGFRGFSGAQHRRTVRMMAANLAGGHAANVRAITQPCLVAYCQDDQLIESEIAHELACTVPAGPRLVFDQGGHALQKRHANEIAAALTAWYAELRPSPQSTPSARNT